MSQSIYRLSYGATTISYTVQFAARRTIAISVAPDLHVTVTAPLETALETIADRVRRRAAWIVRQQRDLAQYLPTTPPRRYVSGESHHYLGRRYRLSVIEQQPERVRLTRGFLHVFTTDKTDTEQVQRLLLDWYATQARRIFCERMQAMLSRFTALGITEAPVLVIKPLQARWGSYSHAGTMTLNLQLIQAPTALIDYVIVHELCHALEYNHSRRFYRLLDRVLPDWRDRRQRLNAYHSI